MEAAEHPVAVLVAETDNRKNRDDISFYQHHLDSDGSNEVYMNSDLAEFIGILENEDRIAALRFILELLDKKKYDVQAAYEQLLTPALNAMKPSGNENIDIWDEHVRTSMVKSIIENMLPYVMAERDALATPKRKTVAVFCPPEEYHDIGARMATDILTIHGYDATLVGANTPLRVFQAGLQSCPTDYVAISISNPYHLIASRNIITSLRQSFPDTKIVVGGHAISKLDDNGVLQADIVMKSLSELHNLEGGQEI